MIRKSIILTLAVVLNACMLFANAETVVQEDSGLSIFNTTNITSVLFFIFLAYATIRVMNLFIRVREIRMFEKYGKAQYLAERNQSWFERFKRMATNAVPLTNEKDILLDHDYDGIKELDNDLPPWWLWMFYLSIVYSIAYFGYYHVLDYGMNSTEEWEYEMKVEKEKVEEYIATQSNLVDETNVTALTDEVSISKGKEIFEELCVACHLSSGAGSVGPNLTDEYWLHGNTIVDVFKTVKYGVPEKGMISWQTQMNAADMHRVSSYILTLEGTNPPNPKEPQGEFYGEGTPPPPSNVDSETEKDTIK